MAKPTTTKTSGALLGAASTTALLALLYLGEVTLGLPFVPFELLDAATRTLPGGLVTAGIDTIVALLSMLGVQDVDRAAKLAEQAMAIGGVLAVGTVFGALLAAWGAARQRRLPLAGALAGALMLALTLGAERVLGFPSAGPVASVLWLAATLIGWGWVLGQLVRHSGPILAQAPQAPIGRRAFLRTAGGGFLALLTAALGVRAWRGAADGAPSTGAPEIQGAGGTSGPAASPPEPTLEARPAPAPGTRPELTPNADFYRIDINSSVPEVDGPSWRLAVEGLVDEPLSLSLDELRAMPSHTQVITLSCISNRIGGDLIGTSRWTGVRLQDVLERAGLREQATSVFIESVDGFFETVVMDDIGDPRTLLVYAMNGVPLPTEHGFPLRIYIPNRYGMKQPKWIERILAVDEERPGYWVERGWSQEARPKVVSQIDDVGMDMMAGAEEGAEVRPVGGIAWAGSRGIERVEVQVDDGPWEAATLRKPALSPLAWVQWRYDWPYEPGRHSFRVRAVDGEGAMQVLEPSGVRPDGATGVDELTTTV